MVPAPRQTRRLSYDPISQCTNTFHRQHDAALVFICDIDAGRPSSVTVHPGICGGLRCLLTGAST